MITCRANWVKVLRRAVPGTPVQVVARSATDSAIAPAAVTSA